MPQLPELTADSLNVTSFQNIGEMKKFLSTVANINELCDQFESTLLHIAAEENILELIPLLLEKEIDVNALNSNGTALHEAVSKQAAVLLLMGGANPFIHDHEGHTALTYHMRRASLRQPYDNSIVNEISDAMDALAEEVMEKGRLNNTILGEVSSNSLSTVPAHEPLLRRAQLELQQLYLQEVLEDKHKVELAKAASTKK